MTIAETGTTGRKGWTIALWIVQILLAVFYGLVGVMKLSMPVEGLATQMNWVKYSPELLVRFIGLCEFAGALGLILPSVTRILPWLTALAALGFVVIQVLAIGTHAMLNELLQVLPMNLVLLALAAFVLWGRTRKAPIAPRS